MIRIPPARLRADVSSQWFSERTASSETQSNAVTSARCLGYELSRVLPYGNPYKPRLHSLATSRIATRLISRTHFARMQPPTCTDMRVRNVHDAQVILHAVAQNKLPMVRRRLDDDERLALRPGHIYVWEERSSNPLEANSLESIQRFTDGRSWGPSKAREYVDVRFSRRIASLNAFAVISCSTTKRRVLVGRRSCSEATA